MSNPGNPQATKLPAVAPKGAVFEYGLQEPVGSYGAVNASEGFPLLLGSGVTLANRATPATTPTTSMLIAAAGNNLSPSTIGNPSILTRYGITNLAISFWFYNDGTNSNGSILGMGNSNGGGIYLAQSGGTSLSIQYPGVAGLTPTVAGALLAGWNRVTIWVSAANGTRVYRNGVFLGTANAGLTPQAISGSGSFVIGAVYNGAYVAQCEGNIAQVWAVPIATSGGADAYATSDYASVLL